MGAHQIVLRHDGRLPPGAFARYRRSAFGARRVGLSNYGGGGGIINLTTLQFASTKSDEFGRSPTQMQHAVE